MSSSSRVIRVARGSLGGARTPELVAVPVRHSVGSAVALNLARIFERLIWWLVAHPVTSVVAAALGWSLLVLGPMLTGVIVGGVVAVLAAWWWRFPASFARRVGWPVRGRWRLLVRYRRHWQPAMATCDLAARYGDREYLPTIRRVEAGRYADRVLVDMLAGQAPGDFEDKTEQFAHTFGALRCAVRVDRPRRIWLDFYHGDALADPIPALPVPVVPDLAGVVIGRTEAGQPWRVRLGGTHVLVAGATDSGSPR